MDHCPVDDCPYPERAEAFEYPKPKRDILESTRSRKSEDAHRDFDDFDVDEELARMRRASRLIRMSTYAETTRQATAFICEAMVNIDEWIVRGGNLPAAWR